MQTLKVIVEYIVLGGAYTRNTTTAIKVITAVNYFLSRVQCTRLPYWNNVTPLNCPSIAQYNCADMPTRGNLLYL